MIVEPIVLTAEQTAQRVDSDVLHEIFDILKKEEAVSAILTAQYALYNMMVRHHRTKEDAALTMRSLHKMMEELIDKSFDESKSKVRKQ